MIKVFAFFATTLLCVVWGQTIPDLDRFIKWDNITMNFPSINLNENDFIGFSFCSFVHPTTQQLILAAGAPGFDDPIVGPLTGIVHLFSLTSTGVGFVPTAVTSIVGFETQGQFGTALECGVDLDQNGMPDLVVSSPFDQSPVPNGGTIALIFLNTSLSMIGSQIIDSNNGNGPTLMLDSRFGSGLAYGPDFDQNGFADLFATELNPRRIHLLSIDQTGVVSDTIFENGARGVPANTFLSAEDFGLSIAVIGDLNGDTIPEIAVGAPRADTTSPDQGRVYILFLNQTLNVVQISTIQAQQGGLPLFSAFDLFGTSISAVGDVTGDEIPDIIVGVPFEDTAGLAAGSAFFCFLDASGNVIGSQQISSNTYPEIGPQLLSNGRFGSALGIANDNDETLTLFIGAPLDLNGGAVWSLDFQICGNGLISGAEACDDGNLNDGDGCSSICTVESAWECTSASPSVCVGICGDANLIGNECDDGNQNEGDGCSSTCLIEAGFMCQSNPSVCEPVCGDGLVVGSESCDDGNLDDGDSCSSSCQSSTAPLSAGGIAGVTIGAGVFVLCAVAICIAGLLIYRSRSPQTLAMRRISQALRDDSVPILTGVAVGEAIGAGNFGKVYKGSWNNIPVALKSLSNQEDLQELANELRIMSTLRHPHVLIFYGIFIDTQNQYFMVLEFMSEGDLIHLLQKNADITTKELMAISLHIAQGMENLHSQDIIHRDLAARNVLLKRENNEFVAKISDFGMSRVVEDFYNTTSKVLPVRWTAPEALQHLIFTKNSDVWSYGIVLFEIFSRGTIPYAGIANTDVCERVQNGLRLSPPRETPEFMAKLMRQCWSSLPEKRPNFRQIAKLISLSHFTSSNQFFTQTEGFNSVIIDVASNPPHSYVNSPTSVKDEEFDVLSRSIFSETSEPQYGEVRPLNSRGVAGPSYGEVNMISKAQVSGFYGEARSLNRSESGSIETRSAQANTQGENHYGEVRSLNSQGEASINPETLSQENFRLKQLNSQLNEKIKQLEDKISKLEKKE